MVVSSVPPTQLGELLGALAVQDAHHVGPVVHGHLRMPVDGRVDVAVVGVVVLAVDRVDLGAVAVDQGGGDVVLGGEGVRCAEHDLGASGDQRPGEVGRLGGHVQAAGHRDPVERPLLLEALADRLQHGHLPIRPLDPALPVVGQGDVGDVVALLGGCQISPFGRDEVGRIGARPRRSPCSRAATVSPWTIRSPVNAEVAVPSPRS